MINLDILGNQNYLLPFKCLILPIHVILYSLGITGMEVKLFYSDFNAFIQFGPLRIKYVVYKKLASNLKI